jgi:hypothetical protein
MKMFRRVLAPILATAVALILAGIFEPRIGIYFDVAILPILKSVYAGLAVWLQSSWLSKVTAAITVLFFVAAGALEALRRQLRQFKASLDLAFRENAQIQAKLRELSEFHRVQMRRDPLTGVPNSRAT